MEAKNSYSIYVNEYTNLDTSQFSTILLKDGTILKVNNNASNYAYGNNSFNRNISDSLLPVNNQNNAAKLRKFNSFSANIKYKTRFNAQNQNNGFYVTPIINGNKKLIAIKVPDNNVQNIELNKDNYHVENFTFIVSPKKYKYKPYKPPKRKNNIHFINTQKNYSYYVSSPNNFNNKKKILNF